MKITIPVLFLIFNRPDTTQKVFDVIRQVKPSKLFVASDGAREGNRHDEMLCKQARNITEQVDWECEVKYLHRDKNLGCRVAITSGIDWFFEHVDEGIILEDDCLPSKSFFWFCQELLEKYRDNHQIMQINGNFYLDGLMDFKSSYYYAKLISCWGWATWKDSWRHFDRKMLEYSKLKQEGFIENYYENKEITAWMKSYLDEITMDSSGIWSTQWAFSIIKCNGLSISPTTNLVQNIGFNQEATTGTAKSFREYEQFTVNDIDVLNHPYRILYDKKFDALHFDTIIKSTDPRLNMNFINYFVNFIKSIIKFILPKSVVLFLKKGA
jgi:hypothetical protein